jgi:hypothetical protein
MTGEKTVMGGGRRWKGKEEMREKFPPQIAINRKGRIILK